MLSSIQLNEEETKIKEYIDRIISPDDSKLVMITSATRPRDTFGFHRLGLAIDLWSKTPSVMVKLHDALVKSNWAGGVALGGLGCQHHVHVDARHLHKDNRFPNGWPQTFFLEVKINGSYVYPVKQYDQINYDKYYKRVVAEYKD